MGDPGDDLQPFAPPGGSACWTTTRAGSSTRFAVLRLLALVYLVAFLVLARQMDPLLGSRGLLPVAQFLSA